MKKSEVRREEKSEEKSAEGRLESAMSGDYSDGEGSVGHEADFVDAAADTEVDLRLPLEVDMQPDQLWLDVPAYLGAIDPSAVDLGQEEQRRFEPPDGAKSKWPRHLGLGYCPCLSLQNPVFWCLGLRRIR